MAADQFLEGGTTVEVLAALDRLGEIPPHLVRARAVAETAGDPAAMARVETAEGLLQRITQDGDRGLAAYHRAAALALKAGDSRLLSRIYHQLADAYHSIEDWERFTYYTEEAFRLLPNPSLTARFNHAIRVGISRFQAYDRDGAEEQFRHARDLAVESASKVNQNFAEGQLGWVYWTFDRDATRASEHYTRAIDLAIDAQAPGMEASWRVHRGNVRRETADYEGALADFQRALALWEASASGDRFAATKHIGHVYRLMGRLDEARAVLEPLVTMRPFNPTPRHLWAARLELASTYEALGDRARAAEQYRTMIDVLEEHRNTSILDTFRSGSFAHSLSAYDPFERYMRFLTDGGGTGGAAAALHVAERARARSFLEMIGAVRSSLASALPEPLLQEQTRLVRKASDIQRRLRSADLQKAARDSLLAQLSGLEEQRDAFLVKLRVEHPAIAEARYPEIAEPTALQPSLRAGESAVVFYLSEPQSFRWIVTRADITFGRIAGRTAIETQAARLRQVFRTPGDPAAARAEAGRLSALLLEGATFTGSSLLVVPHGVLHYVPFEALPHQGSLLIERYAVSYAPSLNSAIHIRRGGGTPAPFRILAVGNPSVHAPDALQASTRAGDIDTVGLLGPLPHAGEEIDAIQRTFGRRAEALSGSNARESAFRGSELGRYSVIHFATHGLVNERRPARSGLLFTAEAGEDGVLQMSEIYRLGLRADLVVLSACQTALGREITGEGIVGLTRAFFYAGSRSVVATLWNLNDRFAAEFVERFYDEVRRGRSTEEALRRTKLAYLEHPQFGHPFYWSSLVLTGDGSRVLYRDSWLMTATLGGLLVLLALATAMASRRRRRRRG